jgi:hypothetical protein
VFIVRGREMRVQPTTRKSKLVAAGLFALCLWALMSSSSAWQTYATGGIHILGVVPSLAYPSTEVHVYGEGATSDGMVSAWLDAPLALNLTLGPINESIYMPFNGSILQFGNSSVPIVVSPPNGTYVYNVTGPLTIRIHVGSARADSFGNWEINFLAPSSFGKRNLTVIDDVTLNSDSTAFEVVSQGPISYVVPMAIGTSVLSGLGLAIFLLGTAIVGVAVLVVLIMMHEARKRRKNIKL